MTEIVQPLAELLQQCIVKVSLPHDAGWGTAFFVAPNTLLTCAHVVQGVGNTPISLLWPAQQQRLEAHIQSCSEALDLAVLTLAKSKTDVDHPCVDLSEDIRANDLLYSYGFPDDFPDGSPVTFEAEGLTGGQNPFIRFKAGQVRPGLSGAPILNQRTGKVCGMVKFTRDRATDLGGGAIPMKVIFAQLKTLREEQYQFHRQDSRWRRALETIPVQAQDRQAGTTPPINITINNAPVNTLLGPMADGGSVVNGAVLGTRPGTSVSLNGADTALSLAQGQQTVMGGGTAFDHDVFISYATVDNESLSPEQEGWVSFFHRALEYRLTQLRGEHPQILWQDPKLPLPDQGQESLLGPLTQVASVVSVLSRGYLKSNTCLHDLQRFAQLADQTGGVRVGNHSRLFKVIKTVVPLEKHPQMLSSLPSYEFFERDQSDRPREFSKLFGPESERKYMEKVEDLAYDIHLLLEALESIPQPPPVRPQTVSQMPQTLVGAGTVMNREPLNQAFQRSTPAERPLDLGQPQQTIYLAETLPELTDERDRIRRELQLWGHTVVPDQPLPEDEAEFAQAVEAYLAQSSLSIHLLSPMDPAGGLSPRAMALQQLVMALCQEQVELAGRWQEAQPNATRLLWVPPHVKSEAIQANAFLAELQGDANFLQIGVEDLKTVIQDHLTRPEPSVMGLDMTSDTRRIYLDCDVRDLEQAPDILQLSEYLEQQFEVVLPDYEPTGLSDSEQRLQQCDGVLIYYGQASGVWLKRRLLAWKKTLYGRLRPLLAQAIYVAAPVNPSKQALINQSDLLVIQGVGAFAPHLLDPFVNQLHQGQGGL